MNTKDTVTQMLLELIPGSEKQYDREECTDIVVPRVGCKYQIHVYPDRATLWAIGICADTEFGFEHPDFPSNLAKMIKPSKPKFIR